MTVHTRVAKPLVDSLRKALTSHALPGETLGLTRGEAAEFLAGVAVRRRKSVLVLSLLLNATALGAVPNEEAAKRVLIISTGSRLGPGFINCSVAAAQASFANAS